MQFHTFDEANNTCSIDKAEKVIR